MNIFEVLRQDHEKVAELLTQFENQVSSHGENASETFFKIKTILQEHTEAEEALFYPIIDGQPGVENLIEKAREQHNEVEKLMVEMETLIDGEISNLIGITSDLRSKISEHVFLEESEIFDKAEEFFTPQEALKLGEEMLKAEPEAHADSGQRESA